MATFCFAERPRDLFVEGVARGFLSAIRDFPHYKGHDEAQAALQRVLDDLRPEVCCIPVDEYPYFHLIVSAWENGYRGCLRCTERQMVMWVSLFADVPDDEATGQLAAGFARDEEIEEAYARFQAQSKESRTPV